MGLDLKIKIKIVYQFVVSLEVFKVVAEVPLSLDEQVHDLSVFI